MTKDLTSGSPLKVILMFTLPLVLGNLFQQFYALADTIIVGRFCGVSALASVGATGSVNYLILGFVIGVCNGFAIPIAQLFGARDYSDLRRHVANAAWLCIAGSVVLTVTTVALTRPMMQLMQTPDDIIDGAVIYIGWIFAGIPFIFLYNMVASYNLMDSFSAYAFFSPARTPTVVGAVLAVLTAPVEDLRKVEGVGESAAVLLKVAGQIGRKARLSDAAQSRAMTDVETVGAYLLERYAGETHEVVYQLCLDRKGKLLACKRLNDGGASSASLDIRKVVENAILTSASTVILAHNHPSGIALPSDDDCAATTQAVQALQTIGVVLADHIIVADDDFVSMAQSGYLS